MVYESLWLNGERRPKVMKNVKSNFATLCMPAKDGYLAESTTAGNDEIAMKLPQNKLFLTNLECQASQDSFLVMFRR